MDRFRRVALAAALESGIFIKKSVGKVGEISYKGRINIVTDIDKKSEAIILNKIHKSFPSHSILTEESAPITKKSSYKWIVDPIDGTTNFAHGFPFFCVSIALELDGESVLGVVYDPMRDEMFSAVKGMGATLNGKKIRVSKVSELSKAMLATGFSYGIKGAGNTNIDNFSRFLMRAQAIRRAGSAALDMCYVACGRFDGFWELDLYPWDCAAAEVIVKESKGNISRLDGSAYSHYDKEILTTNALIHKEMVSVFVK